MAAPVVVMMLGRYVTRLVMLKLMAELESRLANYGGGGGGGGGGRRDGIGGGSVAPTLRGRVQAPMAVSKWDEKQFSKLLKKAGKLKRNKNRIVTAAMRAGLRITAKEIKANLPAYSTKRTAARRVSTGRYRSIAGSSKMKEAKKAVGSLARVSKGGRGPVPRGEPEGKVGSNVGMKRTTSSMRARRRQGNKGIGRGNLHWYLMGTAPRVTGTGIYTGKMRRVTVVQRAWAATNSLVMAKMKRNLAAGIKREAAKP